MKLKIYKTKVEYDWWYILPTIEIKHKYWYLWQIMFSWLCWSFVVELSKKLN